MIRNSTLTQLRRFELVVVWKLGWRLTSECD